MRRNFFYPTTTQDHHDLTKMCSTCDCDNVANKLATNLAISHRMPCRKCASDPFIVVDKIHVECKKCFLESCNKKIRSTIGKSKLLRNNDPILIAYSGGPSSTALLDLICNSIRLDARREQKFLPSILHVDMQSIHQSDLQTLKSERCRKLESLLNHLSHTYPHWPIYWTTLELCMVTKDNENETIYSKYNPRHGIESHSNFPHPLLDNVQAHEAFIRQMTSLDLTDRQQYVQDSCTDLICHASSAINNSFNRSEDKFKYVLTASSATQLANNLLVDVILGRGSTIRSTVSICDTRLLIPIMRPMRDFSKKEIAFYLKARNIEPIVERNLLTFADRKASIQTVTEAFLSKLYVDYPSTYSTLLRTGNKMQS